MPSSPLQPAATSSVFEGVDIPPSLCLVASICLSMHEQADILPWHRHFFQSLSRLSTRISQAHLDSCTKHQAMHVPHTLASFLHAGTPSSLSGSHFPSYGSSPASSACLHCQPSPALLSLGGAQAENETTSTTPKSDYSTTPESNEAEGVGLAEAFACRQLFFAEDPFLYPRAPDSFSSGSGSWCSSSAGTSSRESSSGGSSCDSSASSTACPPMPSEASGRGGSIQRIRRKVNGLAHSAFSWFGIH